MDMESSSSDEEADDETYKKSPAKYADKRSKVIDGESVV